MNDEQITALVTEGFVLDEEVELKNRRLKEIKAELAKLAPGTYRDGEGHSAQVILPSPAIKPGTAAIAAAREALEESEFKSLFDRFVNFKPVKDWRAKASVLLTPAKLRRVTALCEVPATPYVVFK